VRPPCRRIILSTSMWPQRTRHTKLRAERSVNQNASEFEIRTSLAPRRGTFRTLAYGATPILNLERSEGFRVICVPAPLLIHAECQSFEERYRFCLGAMGRVVAAAESLLFDVTRAYRQNCFESDAW
jgi:hypothetical protein